jgi:hypothetical protein
MTCFDPHLGYLQAIILHEVNHISMHNLYVIEISIRISNTMQVAFEFVKIIKIHIS